MSLFNGKDARLCMDQCGGVVWARTLKELREGSGYGSSPQKQYTDRLSGETVHSGYVIGPRWFTIYAPVMAKA